MSKHLVLPFIDCTTLPTPFALSRDPSDDDEEEEEEEPPLVLLDEMLKVFTSELAANDPVWVNSDDSLAKSKPATDDDDDGESDSDSDDAFDDALIVCTEPPSLA